MKVVYYLSCALIVNSFSGTVWAAQNSVSGITPIERVLPKSTTSIPKLSTISSEGIKLASVNFIAKTDAGRNFHDKDTSNSCSGYPYTTEMAIANCASVSICRDGHLQKVKCTSCKNNMTLGTDGRCKCNQSTYKYSLTGSVTGGGSCTYGFDEDNKCQEIDSSGALRTYYAGCLCPNNWYECNDTGQIGSGTACVEKGKTKYAGCTCKSNYSYRCNESTSSYTEYGVGTPCLNTTSGLHYYTSCGQSCRSGYYQSVYHWWSSCVIPTCNGTADQFDDSSCENAAVGDYVYSDKTCGTEPTHANGNQAVGVIIDTQRRLMINTCIANSYVQWDFNDTRVDIAGIPNYTSEASAATDFDGKAHTKLLFEMDYGHSPNYYSNTAAMSCYDWTEDDDWIESQASYTSTSSNGNTYTYHQDWYGWYMPALGELKLLYSVKNIIDPKLNASCGDHLGYYAGNREIFLSSTEYDANYVWAYRVSDNTVHKIHKSDSDYNPLSDTSTDNYTVRCFHKY